MVDTPVSLLERLARPGDAEAWSRFVELYTPLLYGWARRAGLQEADAADLVQDVLTTLFRKLPEFAYNPNRSFRGWLRTVVLNKWRENHRRGRLGRGSQPTMLDEVPAPDAMAALEEVEYRQVLVARALRVLRGEFAASLWSLFNDYVLLEQSAETVADAHGVQIGTVYAAKSRVLARLREELRGLLD